MSQFADKINHLLDSVYEIRGIGVDVDIAPMLEAAWEHDVEELVNELLYTAAFARAMERELDWISHPEYVFGEIQGNEFVARYNDHEYHIDISDLVEIADEIKKEVKG